MKQTKQMLFVLLCGLFFLTSCTKDKDENKNENKVNIDNIILNKNNLSLVVGNSETLVATLTPIEINTTVNWTSSDTSIAIVDGTGKVSVLAAGTATITASAGGKSAKCKVTATPMINTENRIVAFTLNGKYAGIIDHESKKITVDIIDEIDITALKTNIKLSDNATVSPASNTIVNFNDIVVFTVTAENGVAAPYNVFVTTPLTQGIKIFSFVIPNIVEATVDALKKQIVMTVPRSTNITNIKPIITISDGAQITPKSDVSQNFSAPISYVISGASGKSVTYKAFYLYSDFKFGVSSFDKYTINAGEEFTINGEFYPIGCKVFLLEGNQKEEFKREVNVLENTNNYIHVKSIDDLKEGKYKVIVEYNNEKIIAPSELTILQPKFPIMYTLNKTTYLEGEMITISGKYMNLPGLQIGFVEKSDPNSVFSHTTYSVSEDGKELKVKARDFSKNTECGVLLIVDNKYSDILYYTSKIDNDPTPSILFITNTNFCKADAIEIRGTKFKSDIKAFFVNINNEKEVYETIITAKSETAISCKAPDNLKVNMNNSYSIILKQGTKSTRHNAGLIINECLPALSYSNVATVREGKGQEVYIAGIYLTRDQFEIYYGGIKVDYTIGMKDGYETLLFKVPKELPIGKTTIEVFKKSTGTLLRQYDSEVVFNTEITSISKKTIRNYENITIKGRFQNKGNVVTASILCAPSGRCTLETNIIEENSEEITFEILYPESFNTDPGIYANDEFASLRVISYGQTGFINFKFVKLTPKILSVDVVKNGDKHRVTITGENFLDRNNKVYIGNDVYIFRQLSATNNTIEFNIESSVRGVQECVVECTYLKSKIYYVQF